MIGEKQKKKKSPRIANQQTGKQKTQIYTLLTQISNTDAFLRSLDSAQMVSKTQEGLVHIFFSLDTNKNSNIFKKKRKK